jgi:hypothetical protein
MKQTKECPKPYLVAHEGLARLNELHCQLMQPVKVVAGVADLPGSPPHPRHNLLRLCIVNIGNLCEQTDGQADRQAGPTNMQCRYKGEGGLHIGNSKSSR